MRKLITVGIGALLLAGCTTPQQRAAAAQAQMERTMVVYGPACTKLGYPANSDTWRNCVLQLSARDDLQRYGYPHYYGALGRSHWSLGGYWGPYW